MSDANVATIRRAVELVAESFAAGGAVPELLAMCAPDVRVDASRRVFNAETYEGREGLARLIREICEVWEDFHERVDRMIDLDDRVLMLHTIAGRGRSSDVEVELGGAMLWTLAAGRVQAIEIFQDQGEALAYAGVEE
jgi:ketosteroid isomerase-like protein